ncbi:MAG TPA: hypothetical protein VIJ14_07180, partial [Rhabdochlamydiaceae bacterium]
MSQPIQPTGDGQGAWFTTAAFFGSLISWRSRKQNDTTSASTMTSAQISSPLPPPPPASPPLSPILQRSGERAPDISTPPPTPLFRLDEEIPASSAPPVQPSAAASDLERRAKLSYAAQVVDRTSRFFWW